MNDDFEGVEIRNGKAYRHGIEMSHDEIQKLARISYKQLTPKPEPGSYEAALYDLPLDQTERVYQFHKTAYMSDIENLKAAIQRARESDAPFSDIYADRRHKDISRVLDHLEILEEWYQRRTGWRDE